MANEVNTDELNTTNHESTTGMGRGDETVHTQPAWQRVSKWWWALGAVVIFFALVGVVAACLSFTRMASRHMTIYGRPAARSLQNGFTGRGEPYGMRGGYGGRMMGSTGTTNSATRVSGVVTAVNGNTLTVAGDGTSTKVITTASTTYSGASEPAAVNDTVIVSGTKNSDGTFAATSIRLFRQ